MKITYKASLQRTMIVYLLLIGFAASLIGVEFINDIQRKELRTELMQNFSKLSNNRMNMDEAFQPIQKIRNKAILMVILLFVVVVILLTMFIKNITEPLQHVIEVSKLIDAGDLSQTVSIHAKNELADMGSTVNDLTSNLQEMILLSRDMCATADRFVEEVSGVLNIQEMDREQLKALQREMQILTSRTRFLNDIILNCKFYRIER
jgi:methyl-accepting chemotaxis protein